MIGKILGHYEIVELLGEGGMGKVFRARDTHLDRDVAIKILPGDFAADSERVARFDREAKLLATLNHPNIAAIYGLDDFGDQRFIAMELVEGETLAERIATSGGVEIETALTVARQIAKALEAAHGNGIVHRDLKPANVMVTPDDKVKVLDFGLAKAFEIETSGEQDLTHSPTITMGTTRTGLILGTASYMSPEQAKGQLLDKRTDIFSFGCVLYEMLTGCKPFIGEDVSETLASILREEPNWSLLPAAVPVAALALIRRCLQKNRDRRLHDIADARIEIEDLLNRPLDDSALNAEQATRPPGRRKGWHVLAPWAVATLMTILAAWAIFRPGSAPLGPEGELPRVSRLTIPTEPLLTRERASSMVISSDGSHIVYSARDGDQRKKLFLRPIGSLEAAPIEGTEGAIGPFLSPDGKRVGFVADGELRTVSIEGGPPTTLQKLSVFLGGHWGADDSIVYGEWPTRSLWRVPAAGGAPQSLTEGLSDFWFYIPVAPSFVPDSRTIAFNSFTSFTGPDKPLVRLSSIDSRSQTSLEIEGTNVHYLPSGHLVFASGGSLLAVPFDTESLTPRGAPLAVLADVLTNSHGTAQYDVSATGTLVYVQGGEERIEHRLAWVDRAGTSSFIAEEIRPFWGPRLSPDGSRISTWIASDPAGVWIYDIARGGMSRLTQESSGGYWSLWAADGERLAFTRRDEAGSHVIGWQLVDRSAPFEALVDSEKGSGQPLSWARDGRALIYQDSRQSDTGFDLYEQSLVDDSDPRLLVQTAANEFQGVLAPGGEWLAYVTDESGRREVYVKSFPDTARTILVSTGGGQEPLWAPSGRELFYRNEGQVMVVDIETAPEFRAGRPRSLFEDRFVPGTPYGRNWDISPDGQRFVMIESAATAATATQIVVVQNWFEELKRLVPTRSSSR